MAMKAILIAALLCQAAADKGTVAPKAQEGIPEWQDMSLAEKIGVGVGAGAAGVAVVGGIAAASKQAADKADDETNPKTMPSLVGVPPKLNAKIAAEDKEFAKRNPPKLNAKKKGAGGAAATTNANYDSSSGVGGTSLASATSASVDSIISGDSSGSQKSINSTHSGSSGFYMPILLWVLLVALFCVCCGGAILKKKKKRATKKKKGVAMPAPEPAAGAEAGATEFDPMLPALIPLATTSAVLPSYSMVAAPQYMNYAAPATTAYAAAPTMQYAAPMSYAQPTMTYAQPSMGTMTYAAAQPTMNMGYAQGAYQQQYF